MIKYKNFEFEDYFIDPITAVITDVNGNKVRQYDRSGYLVVYIHKMQICVHCIMAHTYLGYKEEPYVVDHKDENKHNNALNNLHWLKRGINVSKSLTGKPKSDEAVKRMKIANTGQKRTTETKQKQRENKLGRLHWVNANDEHLFQKDCPGDGWINARKFKI